MANDVEIDSLSIAIEEGAADTAKNLKSLASGLKKLQKVVETVNFNSAINQFSALGNAADSIEKFGRALTGLQGVKLSSTLAKQLTSVSTAAKALEGQDFTKLAELAAALKPLGELGRAKLTSFTHQLEKLPQVAKDLEAADMDRFAATIERLTNAMKPLATEMDKVARGFAAFPQRIQKFIANNEKASASAKKSQSKWNGFFNTLINGSAKSGTAISRLVKQMFSLAALNKLKNIFTTSTASANEYIETLNLFNVSMGKFTKEAQEYAELASESYGIDPAEFMRMQAVVMDMSKSFGVSADTAYKMSRALTQLTYDISSLYNMNIDEAATKVQSALAGEIEPIRRLGKDLSVANLKLIASELGIKSNVDAMRQSEKAMLRTIALLRQSTSAMGDMSRTLEQPANQFRILKAQIDLFTRSLGNLLLPVVQKVLPYFIAFIKVSRQVVMAFADLAGFRLPEFDYGDSVGNLEQISEEAENAADSIERLHQLSFDELNILGTSKSSTSGIGLNTAEIAKLEAELNRLTKIEDELFSERLGLATDEIAKNMEKWLTKGRGVEEWANNIVVSFGKIKDFAAKTAEKLGLWRIPSALSSLLSDLGLDVSFGTINTDYTEAKVGNSRGEDTLKKVIGLGIAGALGLTAIGAITGNAAMGGLLSRGLGLALGIGALKMLFDDIKDDGTDTSDRNGLYTSLKSALELALFGTSLSLMRGKGLKFSFGLGLSVAGLKLFADGIKGMWDGNSGNDLSSAVMATVGVGLGGVGLTQLFGGKDLRYGLALGLAVSSFAMIFKGANKIHEEGNVLEGLTWEAIGVAFGGLAGALAGSALGVGAVAGAGWGLMLTVPFAILFSLEKIGFLDKGRKFIEDSVDAINKWGEDAADKIKSLFTGGTSKKTDTLFPDLGEDVVDGITKGLMGGENSLKRSISGLANTLEGQFRKDLGIHSPSKVFEQHGINIDQGLANGIGDNEGIVLDVFHTMLAKIESLFTNFTMRMYSQAAIFAENLLNFGDMSFGAVEFSGRVPAYASGGFPEDGMFFANSGELVGRFANGRTAVANNEEIISGIANGVREANNELIGVIYSTARQVVQAMQNGSNVYIDGKKISKSVTDAQNRSNRMHGASQQNV